MADINETINMLRRIADGNARYWVGNNLGDMIEIDGLQKLAHDAVELLNQYQTRTLTEQEMDDQIDAYDGSAVFFIEEKKFGKLYQVYLCRNNPVRNDPNFFALNLECYFIRSGINKYWRCWNRKPTDEQREEAPWGE